MLRMSGLLDLLEAHCNTAAREPLCIYGDPAYPLRRHLQSPYRDGNLDKETSVEWVFGDITRYLAFVNFKHNLKIGLSPIGKIYSVCALLRNALTCLHGSTTSSFFDLAPPTIQEYFQADL